MVLNQGYAQADGDCQWHPLGGPVTRTWQRNVNYRHGRWCRYRHRLECRVVLALAALRRYRAEAPRHAPFARPDPGEHVGRWLTRRGLYLPRRDWDAARALIRFARMLPGYLRLWKAQCAAGLPEDRPLPVLAVLGALFSGIGRSP